MEGEKGCQDKFTFMKFMKNHLWIKLPHGQILVFWVTIVFYFLKPFSLIAQKQDTVYIKFNENYEEMRKVDLTSQMQARSPDEKLKRSVVYYIEQMEPPCGYDNEFNFTHINRDKETYKEWDLEPPVILQKEKSLLRNKKFLDINFFRTTPYLKIAKTFEEEDSWKQDVMIFMVDVDEIKNDSIILREVKFGRPVKE